MQISELEIYAKSALIVMATAHFNPLDQTYALTVDISVNGKKSSHGLQTARGMPRKFKSLDTLSRFFMALPHSQIPLLYVERTTHP